MRKKTKRYNQLIAINLIDRMKQIEQDPPPIIGFTISRLQYLISLILSHKQDNHPGAWSVLKMEYLNNVIHNSVDYLRFLKDENIIEWKNYWAGNHNPHCRLYRLVNEGKTEYRTITDKKLIFKIEKNRRKIQARNSRKYPALNNYIHRVQIDYDSALKTIEDEYKKNRNTDPVKAEGRRTFSLAEVEKIETGQIYIKCNQTNGRLDSNYTRFPGELVQHLNIDGYPLKELDMCNSQPFFSATLFNPTPEIENLITRYLGRSFTMLVKSLHLSEYKDVKLYRFLVTHGYFYDPFLMEKFKENGIPFGSREDIKEQLFIIFFGKNHADKYSQSAKLFRSIFPNVQKLFDEIKNGEHNRLAILLQRIESYTILQRVAQNILTELPGVPFITRHDSLLPSGIMVYKEADKVKEIMLATVKEVTGLMPQVRVKNGKNRPSPSLITNSNLNPLFTLLPILILGFPL